MVEAADADIAAAIADRFPSINLIGNYGRVNQDIAAGLIEGDFWSLLGNFTMPIFDAGRRRAEVDRNKAVARERVAAYQQAALNAFREVEDALARNRETELRIESLEETEQATGATLRLTLDRYLFGVTDYLPVLTSQRAHFEAQSRLLSARRQLITARIGLARALGGDWMAAEITRRKTAQQDEKL
jgi:outer membrane protein TolC